MSIYKWPFSIKCKALTVIFSVYQLHRLFFWNAVVYSLIYPGTFVMERSVQVKLQMVELINRIGELFIFRPKKKRSIDILISWKIPFFSLRLLYIFCHYGLLKTFFLWEAYAANNNPYSTEIGKTISKWKVKKFFLIGFNSRVWC